MEHAGHNRPFFQRLAAAAGLVPSKVWLDYPKGNRHLFDGYESDDGYNDEGREFGGSGERGAQDAAIGLVMNTTSRLQHCTHMYANGSKITEKNVESLAAARIFPYVGKARATTALLRSLLSEIKAEDHRGFSKGQCRGG